MKKQHRTMHRLIWVLLLPLLLVFVYSAQQGKPAKTPTMDSVPYPSEVGDLP